MSVTRGSCAQTFPSDPLSVYPQSERLHRAVRRTGSGQYTLAQRTAVQHAQYAPCRQASDSPRMAVGRITYLPVLQWNILSDDASLVSPFNALAGLAAMQVDAHTVYRC